jgi:hypothetical protein
MRRVLKIYVLYLTLSSYAAARSTLPTQESRGVQPSSPRQTLNPRPGHGRPAYHWGPTISYVFQTQFSHVSPNPMVFEMYFIYHWVWGNMGKYHWVSACRSPGVGLRAWGCESRHGGSSPSARASTGAAPACTPARIAVGGSVVLKVLILI